MFFVRPPGESRLRDEKRLESFFMSEDWSHCLEGAVEKGDLLEDSKKNILRLLGSSGAGSRVEESVRELVKAGEWGELNDRF